MLKNYYEILEISHSATDDDIKSAYRKLALKYHPDKNEGNELYTQKFIEITEAYEVLYDSYERKKYDIDFNFYYLHKTTKNSFDKNKNTTNPYYPYFSKEERENQITEPKLPENNTWGNSDKYDPVFFKYPQNIGRIISAYSNINSYEQNFMSKPSTIVMVILSLVAVLIVSVFSLSILNNFYIPVFIFLFLIVRFIDLMYKNGLHSTYTNMYLGVNGFSQIECIKKIDNIILNIELNFNDATDLFVSIYDNFGQRNSYISTISDMMFVNALQSHIIWSKELEYNKYTPFQFQKYIVRFYKNVEENWTFYLEDKFDQTMLEKGFVSFLGLDENKKIKYNFLKLYKDKIEFLNTKEEKKFCVYENIKEVFINKSFLKIIYFDHNKTLNEDQINLNEISNRLFFYKIFSRFSGFNIE